MPPLLRGCVPTELPLPPCRFLQRCQACSTSPRCTWRCRRKAIWQLQLPTHAATCRCAQQRTLPAMAGFWWLHTTITVHCKRSCLCSLLCGGRHMLQGLQACMRCSQPYSSHLLIGLVPTVTAGACVGPAQWTARPVCPCCSGSAGAADPPAVRAPGLLVDIIFGLHHWAAADLFSGTPGKNGWSARMCRYVSTQDKRVQAPESD